MRRIILASASPRRRELLERAGVKFEVIPASGDENRTSDDPKEAVAQLARDKAVSVKATVEDAEEGTVIIGSDTVVVFQNMILGKPHDQEDAADTLKKLQGNTHQVYTGVSIILYDFETKEKKVHSFHDCTDVEFYPMTDSEINSYIETGDCYDKAGSYGIQGSFAIHVKGIHGDYNNVVGLPIAKLYHELEKM